MAMKGWLSVWEIDQSCMPLQSYLWIGLGRSHFAATLMINQTSMQLVIVLDNHK